MNKSKEQPVDNLILLQSTEQISNHTKTKSLIIWSQI